MNQKSLEQEYHDFCSADAQIVKEEPSSVSKLENVAAGIRSDLVASKWRLSLHYIALSIAGYVATLLVCAQGGVGISKFSHRTTEILMHTFPHPWCAILCGALFSGIPFFLSLAFLNRFQHRYLLFRMPLLLLLIPVVASLSFHILGVWSDESLPFLESSFDIIWLASAVFTPYFLEGVLALLLRQRPYGRLEQQT